MLAAAVAASGSVTASATAVLRIGSTSPAPTVSFGGFESFVVAVGTATVDATAFGAAAAGGSACVAVAGGAIAAAASCAERSLLHGSLIPAKDCFS